MLSAIPNLLQGANSATEDDATDKASIRKNTDELQLAKKENELDDCSAKKTAEKTVPVLSVAAAAASRAQQNGKTAHTCAYKMAEEAETAGQISGFDAKQNKEIAAERRAMAIDRHNKKTDPQVFYSGQSSAKISLADQAYTQKQVAGDIALQADWSQQFTTVVLGQEKSYTLLLPEQTVSSCKYAQAAAMPIGITWKVKTDKNMADWLTLINPGRRFLWPGLPEKSCQQIRFGG